MKSISGAFRRIARHINSGKAEYSCSAVLSLNVDAGKLYDKIFFNGNSFTSPMIIAEAVNLRYYPNKPTPEMVNLRVMLLCLASVCYKDFTKNE